MYAKNLAYCVAHNQLVITAIIITTIIMGKYVPNLGIKKLWNAIFKL